MSSSPLQKEASCQAQRLEQAIRQYQTALPLLSRSDGLPSTCRVEAWNLSYQSLDGEFDLDEALAQKLVRSALPNAPTGGLGYWMKHYLLDGPEARAGIDEQLMSAGVGSGNLLGNANSLRMADSAAVGRSASKAIHAGTQRILSGAASSIKINEYMTLYNANKSGKGLPRPRLRITGLRVQVVSPAFGEDALRVARNGSMTASMRKLAMEQTQKVGSLAAGAHWTGKPVIFNGKIGGGALTFLPSAGIDLYHSINRDMAGNVRWDHHRFLIDSAKSQSGNAVGFGVGLGVELALVGLVGFAAAPAIIVGLIAGIAVQAVWNYSSLSDAAGSMAEQALGTHP